MRQSTALRDLGAGSLHRSLFDGVVAFVENRLGLGHAVQ